MDLHHGRHHAGYVKGMSQAAATIPGAGWALAAWVPAGRMVQQVYDHQGNVWQVVNWADDAERLTAARRPEA